MPPPTHRSRDKVFISYSRLDKSWLDKILISLKPVLRDENVDLWHDNRIPPGAKWQIEINQALDSAGVALLLVTQNFLASDYIATNELPPLLAAAEQKGLIVLWIAVSASTYEHTGIAEFQAMNDPKRPLDKHSTPQRKAELVEIARKFAAALKQPLPTELQPATTAYFDWLRSETGYIKITGLKTGPAHRYPVGKLYIKLKNHEKQDLEESLENRCLVIQGDAGSGKSTFIRHIAFQSIPSGNGEPEFPIYIPIRDLEEHITKLHHQNLPGVQPKREDPRWIAHYLAHQQDWGLNQAFFEQKLHESSTIVLLDGLDETPDEVSRRRMAELFSRAAAQVYRNCRFVVTTRPAAYIGDVRLPDFAVERIAPLDEDAIRTFLEAWSSCLYPENPTRAKAHADQLLGQVNARPEIRDSMAPTPVMLTALAAIHYNERRLPDDRADLYKSILYWLAGSRERKPGRRRDKECLKLLALLAFGLQTHHAGRLAQVDHGFASELLRSKLAREQAIAFLEEEELDSGILVSRGKTIEFLHLTFQEYLAASHLEGLREQDQAAAVLERDHRYSPEWREFMCLFAAALSESRVQGLFDLILENAGHTLPGRASALALITTMLKDRKGLEIENPLYREFAEDMIRLFDPGPENHGIQSWTRANAAVAWEKLEDYSRRRLPSDPDYWVDIGPFQIGQFPVTVWEYEYFVQAGGQEPADWQNQLRCKSRPVVYVSWDDANAYCAWASDLTAQIAPLRGARSNASAQAEPVRSNSSAQAPPSGSELCRNRLCLPSDAEWYLAAAGLEKREYPWGQPEPDYERANFNMDVGHTTPVGLFSAGGTPHNPLPVLDMAGNVWEWTSSRYDQKHDWKTLRGGSFFSNAGDLRASYRNFNPPDFRNKYVGFRCLREVSIP